MKKLSFLLFAIFVSVMGWARIDNNTDGLAYTLNPYAYDLSIKSWNPTTRKLTVSFKLNSPPNLNDGDYNSVSDAEPNGIQIYAVDQRGEEYRIGGPGREDIQNCIKNGYMDFTMDLSAGTTVDGYGDKKNLPLDEILTWKVRVKGRNKSTDSNGASVAAPRDVVVRQNDRRPRYPSGVAVGANPYAPNFGKILITHPHNGKEISDKYNRWVWLDSELTTNYTAFNGQTVTGTPAVLEFSPQIKYQTKYQKYKHDYTEKSYFSSSIFMEPHRVRISDDGRIFVSSYHTTAGAAILEYMGENTFRTVVSFDRTENDDNSSAPVATNSRYNRRVIDFDVKGSGDDLKIVVAWVKPKGTLKSSKYWCAKIQCYEYEVGLNGYNLHQTNNGILVAEYNDRQNSSTEHGLIFQAFLNNDYLSSQQGGIGVTYGKGNNNPIWMKVDFGRDKSAPARILYYDNTGSRTTPKKDVTITCSDATSDYYGGHALLVTEDYLITAKAQGNAKIAFYPISQIESTGDLPAPTYEIRPTLAEASTAWYNGIAIDYANNLYVVSEFNGDFYTIPLPLPSGMVETPAPKNSTFSLSQPVPNILATDLKCTPHEKYARYVFSFNVNTVPEYAEIRFYKDEQVMLNNTEANEDYSKIGQHGNCDYYYVIPKEDCKEGRMSIELDILGHESAGKELTDGKLPAGKLYWTVYLKTYKSTSFAPVYIQPTTGNDSHYRLHATVDNNPDNDGFGHIYAIDYKKEKNDANMKDNPCWLMVYSIGENVTNNTNRYAKIQHLTTNDMVQPRRPAVAPDGMVYLTDYGDYRNGANFNSNGTGPNEFKDGGIWLFNPNDPYKDAGKTAAKLSRFYEEDETVSDVCFYHDGSSLKLYKTNTYEEFSHHKETSPNYQDLIWMNNGYRIYTMGYNQDGSIKHQMSLDAATVIPFKVKDGDGRDVGGDANGSISVRATSDGVWFCQNRKGTVAASINANEPYPDTRENVALMFYNNSGERKFQSYTYAGGNLTQYTTSILQSTPGAGMTISPDERYLYVVNHDGDILEFEIGGSAASGKTLTLNNKFTNTTVYKGISTMNFDYAGNLVVTTDQDYPADASQSTQIVVFTMPYTHDNARTIPAPKSQREIPERLAYNDEKTNTEATIAKKPTLVDLYRPMPNTSYSTICLPFDLDLTTLEEGHPYKGADVRRFESATVSEVSGEKMLFLNFSAAPVTSLLANTPYIIQPEVRIPGIVELPTPAANWVEDIANLVPGKQDASFGSNSITFTGVIPKQDITVEQGKTLILVADNRLAEMQPDAGKETGEIQGFRGYFTLAQSLEQGVQAIIRNKDNTLTGLVDVNGQKINIQKYLREGRIFIRVNDTLYTIDGQKVL